MRRRTANARAVETRPPQPQTLQQLRQAYEQRFGKPPHHRMKPETIKAKLNGDLS